MQGIAPVLLNLSSETVLEGDTACVDVTVNGFNDITEFNYSLGWDETQMDFR